VRISGARQPFGLSAASYGSSFELVDGDENVVPAAVSRSGQFRGYVDGRGCVGIWSASRGGVARRSVDGNSGSRKMGLRSTKRHSVRLDMLTVSRLCTLVHARSRCGVERADGGGVVDLRDARRRLEASRCVENPKLDPLCQQLAHDLRNTTTALSRTSTRSPTKARWLDRAFNPIWGTKRHLRLGPQAKNAATLGTPPGASFWLPAAEIAVFRRIWSANDIPPNSHPNQRFRLRYGRLVCD